MIKCLDKNSELNTNIDDLHKIAPRGSYICTFCSQLMNFYESIRRCDLVEGSVRGPVSLEMGFVVKKPTAGPVFLPLAY